MVESKKKPPQIDVSQLKIKGDMKEVMREQFRDQMGFNEMR
jgi:hypothetical protein